MDPPTIRASLATRSFAHGALWGQSDTILIMIDPRAIVLNSDQTASKYLRGIANSGLKPIEELGIQGAVFLGETRLGCRFPLA